MVSLTASSGNPGMIGVMVSASYWKFMDVGMLAMDADSVGVVVEVTVQIRGLLVDYGCRVILSE